MWRRTLQCLVPHPSVPQGSSCTTSLFCTPRLASEQARAHKPAALLRSCHCSLIPAFIDALTPLQPQPPAPPGPSPADYVGTYYSSDTLSIAQVDLYQGQLVWGTNVLGSPLNVLISYFASSSSGGNATDVFAIYITPGTAPCFISELQALDYQHVVFARNDTGAVVTTSLPGWIPGVVWTKV